MNQIAGKNHNPLIIEAFHPSEFLQEEVEERGTLKKGVAKELVILPLHSTTPSPGSKIFHRSLQSNLKDLFM